MATEPVIASVLINAAPEQVFEYFTRPDAIVRWMGDYASLDAVTGGRFEVDVRGTPIRGCYLELEPPNRLLISWGYAGSEQLPPGASTVEVQLSAQGDGTLVVVEHRDLPSDEVQNHAVGWSHYLARLQLAGAHLDAGADPGMPTPTGA